MGKDGYSGMPDILARRILVRNGDPADATGINVTPTTVCPQLSEVQKAVLKTLRSITLSDKKIREDQSGWIQYDRVPDLVTKFGFFGDSADSHRSMVSNSVNSLAEQKYVAAAIPAWHRSYGRTSLDEEEASLGIGGHPWPDIDSSPEIHYIRLTATGHKLARHLLDRDKTEN